MFARGSKPTSHGTAPCSSQSVARQPSRPSSLGSASLASRSVAHALSNEQMPGPTRHTLRSPADVPTANDLQRRPRACIRLYASSIVCVLRVRSLISRRDIYFRAAPECGSQVLRMSPHPDRKRKESHGVCSWSRVAGCGECSHVCRGRDVGVSSDSPDSGFIDGLCLSALVFGKLKMWGGKKERLRAPISLNDCSHPHLHPPLHPPCTYIQ
jgi:hypothetical protein